MVQFQTHEKLFKVLDNYCVTFSRRLARDQNLPALPGKKKKVSNGWQTLQHVGFTTLTGGLVYLDEFDRQKPTVIIYFNPDCEHCQYEATEISRHAEQFGNANTILITPEPLVKKVKAFAQTYHLNEVDNLAILIDKDNRFY